MSDFELLELFYEFLVVLGFLTVSAISVALVRAVKKSVDLAVEIVSAVLSVDLVFKNHRFGKLFTDTNDGVEGGKRILENHRDFVASDLVEVFLVDFKKVFTVVEYLAAFDDRVVSENSENCSDRNGFTRAGLAYYAEGFAFFEVETDVSYCLNLSVTGSEGYFKIVNFKFFHFLILRASE